MWPLNPWKFSAFITILRCVAFRAALIDRKLAELTILRCVVTNSSHDAEDQILILRIAHCWVLVLKMSCSRLYI
ncbi:hypothetical protein F5882DRAFT_141045 [Hyaloscypha sp. PMI_1271]|nr:hypothetical protein F5882DRAFT_141045 [Hyaloscypha sp. PMI_1271]